MPKPKKSGRAAITRLPHWRIRRKESGRIIRQPNADTNIASPSVIDKMVDLQQKLSGKPHKGKNLIDGGEEGTDAILRISTMTNTSETIVDQVEKFSGALQNVASLFQPVRCLPPFIFYF
jgi:hypothetical protein